MELMIMRKACKTVVTVETLAQISRTDLSQRSRMRAQGNVQHEHGNELAGCEYY